MDTIKSFGTQMCICMITDVNYKTQFMQFLTEVNDYESKGFTDKNRPITLNIITTTTLHTYMHR